MISVDKIRCPQNHKCPAIKVCPVNAISQTDYKLPVVSNDICIQCKKCINFCPMHAIQLV